MSPTPEFERAAASSINSWRHYVGRLSGQESSVPGQDWGNLLRAIGFDPVLADTWSDTVELFLETSPLVKRNPHRKQLGK